MRRLIPVIAALLMLFNAAPAFAGPGISYGPPEVMKKQWVVRAPHVYLVTTYWRPVYKNDIYQYHEKLPGETSEDACYAFLGDPYPDPVGPLQWGPDGHLYLVQTYSQKVYHRNNIYGTFVVDVRQNPALTRRTDVTPDYILVKLAKAPVKVQPQPGGPRDLLQAARNVNKASDFDDYRSQITANTYKNDIAIAAEKGLIQGKYDATSRYYDPNALITVGEMANILARNFGAAPGATGNEALAYLRSIGVVVNADSKATLDLATLQSMARALGQHKGIVDLQVLKDALNGTLVTDLNGGITRGHAVQIAHPAQEGQVTTAGRTSDNGGNGSATGGAPGRTPESSSGSLANTQHSAGSAASRAGTGGGPGGNGTTGSGPVPGNTHGAGDPAAFTLTAALNPAAVAPGGQTTLVATTSLPATRAQAVLWDGHAVGLAYRGGTWTAQITAPAATSGTRLAVRVVAYRGTRMAEAHLTLAVTEEWQEQWRFVLSD